MNNSKDKQQLDESLKLLKDILGPDLLGVYVYGSFVLEGLNKYSDIDLLVVTDRKTSLAEKSLLIGSLLQISGLYMKGPKRPLEITLVEKKAITWPSTPRCDFQYGEWLRESFESGEALCESSEMPDLAIIITQVLLKSEVLFGQKPEELLAKVPYEAFMKAMLTDIDRLLLDIENDTRNVLLTLARICCTVYTDEIRSKPAAADWVMKFLPENYRAVLKRAKDICLGLEHEHWEDLRSLLRPCAEFLAQKISDKASLVDEPEKQIRVFEQKI